MRKTTKGAIAVGAGVALLLGGAGTLAYWTDSADLESESVVAAGNLDLEPVASSAAWTWAADGTTFAPASSYIVPGDTVVFTQRYTVTAQGDHLSAELDVDGLPGLTANTPSDATNLLVGQLNVTESITVVGVAPAAVAGSGSDLLTITDAGAAQIQFQVDVAVEIEYPFGIDEGQDGTTQSVNLSDLTVALSQTV